MKKNKILITLILLLTAITGAYATIGQVVKPEIQRVAYWSGKWHINYHEVKNGVNLTQEELFVDGVSDRVVNVGTSASRGFSLAGTYDRNSCHKAHIVVYNRAHQEVSRTATFTFGNAAKCGQQSQPKAKGTANINSIRYSGGKWNINYKDIPASSALGIEKIIVDGVEDRHVTAGSYSASLTRGFSLNKHYSKNTCHKAYMVVYNRANQEVSRTATFTFGNTAKCGQQSQPKAKGTANINSIRYSGGKWNINYKDIPASSALGIEKIIVDGVEDRHVTAGSYSASLTRGFSLNKYYSQYTCHKAYMVVYNKANQEVSRTATFNFGRCR